MDIVFFGGEGGGGVTSFSEIPAVQLTSTKTVNFPQGIPCGRFHEFILGYLPNVQIVSKTLI